jgi:hypothetical protein
MATVTLTARYLDHLKSHGKRFEVFDVIVPGLASRVSASGRKRGTKKSQQRDIATAHVRWKDDKKRKSQET